MLDYHRSMGVVRSDRLSSTYIVDYMGKTAINRTLIIL